MVDFFLHLGDIKQKCTKIPALDTAFHAFPLSCKVIGFDRLFLTAHGGFWPTFTFSMSNYEVKNVENGLTKVMGT